MPEPNRIVINTSPLIALVAAWGDLEPLPSLYERVLVPFEVCQEILQGGSKNFATAEFQNATWLDKQPAPLSISPLLLNSLDLGEASVIQLALNESIATVCIDEAAGRRIARLSGLSLTGSRDLQTNKVPITGLRLRSALKESRVERSRNPLPGMLFFRTSPMGILLKFKRQNLSFSVKQAIANMQAHNIRLSQTVVDFALQQAGEVN